MRIRLEWATAFRECSDLDGLQALQAEDVLNVRRKIARRGRTPKMDMPEMLSPVQENKDKLLRSKGKEAIDANTKAHERGDIMKKAENKDTTTIDDMRPEYDFSAMKGAVRGKYCKAYREGHKVIIHKEDGTDLIQHFKLEDGAVMLEPDVRKYFPTSEAVNKVLRSLIEIIPVKKSAGHRR